MKNIILIGMPGVGKSTLGVVLAKVLGFQFVDADLLIQKQEKRKLHQIIEDEGTDRFMEIENQVNASITGSRTVIATGGSVVYCQEAMAHLSGIGKVVYLKVSLDELERRLGNLKRTLKDLYEERVPLYEKYADVILDEEERDMETCLQCLLERLEAEIEG